PASKDRNSVGANLLPRSARTVRRTTLLPGPAFEKRRAPADLPPRRAFFILAGRAMTAGTAAQARAPAPSSRLRTLRLRRRRPAHKVRAMKPIHVIGGGLAGSEAAYQIARSRIPVVLHEMRPFSGTEAHKTAELAELVCSNSFRSY